MKLGASYVVFDGEELLPFAARSNRQQIDFISVVYQTTSYFGKKADPELTELLQQLKKDGVVNELIHFEPNLNLISYDNEIVARNIGIKASRDQGCTHHISWDVDEFFTTEQFAFAKEEMERGDFDCSVVWGVNYYKQPTWKIVPEMGHQITFIQKAAINFTRDSSFPLKIDPTRRPDVFDKCRIFHKEEVTQHHMSWVRKNMRKKVESSANNKYYNTKKFLADFDKYSQAGQLVCLFPDFINRKTELVPNQFNIEI